MHKVTIGSATLYNADCLDVMREMGEGSVDAVITDPPYGIDYQSARRIEEERFKKIDGDKSLDFAWINETYRITKPIACLLLFCRWDTEKEFYNALVDSGWDVQSQVIWDRGVHGLGDLKKQYAPMHDNLLFATKGKYEFPAKRPKSVYRVDRVPACNLQHPNEKPIALMQRIIIDLTKQNDVIIDPFMGSGSTLIGGIKEKRQNLIGVEKTDYFEIACKRVRDAAAQPTLWSAV